MRKISLLFILLGISGRLMAQGTFSGDLMMNANFFMDDPAIKATGNPLYSNALSGSDAWLSLRYNVSGFTFFLRADAFANSNLKNPTQPSTDFGIGAWNITKDLKDLTITVGSIYDQIGSGILFRSYEDRGLLIDNAVMGVELKYRITPNIQLKGFVGQMKNNNAILVNTALHTPPFGPVIKGFNAEGDYNIGNVHLGPGIGVLNRTLDGNSMSSVVETINSQSLSTRFLPRYNMYAFTAYNTLTYKNFSLYVEGAYKTHEAISTPDSAGTNLLVDKPGNVQYISMNYGKKGIALSLTGKRTQDFVMRTSPQQVLLAGMLNWQPIVAVLRPMRLMSRFSPPSQDISEMAANANMTITPSDVTSINLSYTHINKLDNTKLFRELFVQGEYQSKSWVLDAGVQVLEYNALVYQVAPYKKEHPVLYAVTPFAEATYRISEKRSIRIDAQYMISQQDYGSWAFLLIEYNIAPKWSFAVSDMYNIVVNKNSDHPNFNDVGFANQKAQHYYNFFIAYTKNATRFTVAYVKQVDGINCTGGVCRYEPAFSGVKATLTSSF